MNITIKDIARETGLSIATISKYLNNKKISPENYAIIEEVIQRLNYVPNKTAQRLRSKSSKTIAIINPDLSTHFWGELVSSVTNFFMKLDYMVITYSYSFDTETEQEIISQLIAQNFDGVIFLPFSSEDTIYYHLIKAGIPTVLIDQKPNRFSQFPVDYVISDNYNGSATLARHLLKLGHTNVSIFGTAPNLYSITQRVQGFMDVYKEHNLFPNTVPANETGYVLNIESIHENCLTNLKKLLELPEPPTAIFSTNFMVSIELLSAINSLGLSVPNDFSIVGFDDSPLFKSLRASMTCISQNISNLGTVASEILLKRMENDYSDFPYERCIDVEFHSRRSVKDILFV